MVPTARAYAGLCQEAQTAFVVELGACSHKRVAACEFQTQVFFGEESFVWFQFLVTLI